MERVNSLVKFWHMNAQSAFVTHMRCTLRPLMVAVCNFWKLKGTVSRSVSYKILPYPWLHVNK